MSNHRYTRYTIQAILCEMDPDVYLNTMKYYLNYQLNFTGKYSTFLTCYTIQLMNYSHFKT